MRNLKFYVLFIIWTMLAVLAFTSTITYGQSPQDGWDFAFDGFPIIGYSGVKPYDAQIQDYKACGFNLLLSLYGWDDPNIGRTLDIAADNDIMLIINCHDYNDQEKRLDTCNADRRVLESTRKQFASGDVG